MAIAAELLYDLDDFGVNFVLNVNSFVIDRIQCKVEFRQACCSVPSAPKAVQSHTYNT